MSEAYEKKAYRAEDYETKTPEAEKGIRDAIKDQTDMIALLVISIDKQTEVHKDIVFTLRSLCDLIDGRM